MERDSLHRRDFHRLAAAALGGALAGSIAGCSEKPQPPAPQPGGARGAGQSTPEGASKEAELHACRGLNSCKGQGADGKNDCAGRGSCASTAARHNCHGQNTCKGLGGCGSDPGANDCKQQGACAVPLMESAWETARKRFEEQRRSAGKSFGDAPATK
jgi:hypothetical protein